MAAAKNPTAGTKDRNFVIKQMFDAPGNLVFKAWTDPKKVSNWWGPNGFTMPVCTIDLRPGGIFHYCMRSPDGKDFWGKGVYREIIESEKLVYLDCFSDSEGNVVQPSDYGMSPEWPTEIMVTITFSERGGKTEVTITSGVSESFAKQVGAQQGWNESLNRLSRYLVQPVSA
jgi:uncharacterized protein YndB with AHSA1/START domain